MGIILILFFFKKIQKQSIRITDHTTSAKSFIKNCIISYLVFLYKLGIAGSKRIFLPALQNLFFIFHIKGLDSHYTIKKTIPLFNCLLNGKVLRFPDCISGHLSAEFFIMCQLQHRICKFLCIKSFRQVSCFPSSMIRSIAPVWNAMTGRPNSKASMITIGHPSHLDGRRKTEEFR